MDDERKKIRRILAGLYNNMDQAKMIARDIGLNLERVPSSPIMEVYWSNIYEEAIHQNKKADLIKRVQEDYPDIERRIQREPILRKIVFNTVDDNRSIEVQYLSKAGREKLHRCQRRVEELKSIHNMLH